MYKDERKEEKRMRRKYVALLLGMLMCSTIVFDGCSQEPAEAEEEESQLSQAVLEYSTDTDESGQEIISVGKDENGVRISRGARVTMRDFSISRDSQDSEFLLRCTGNSGENGWGQTGKNGASCVFTARKQQMEGDIIWDSISELDCYLTENSIWTGAALQDETWAQEEGGGYGNLYIEEGSTWIVTGDSKVSSLYSSGNILDENGDPVSIRGTDGTVYVSGTGKYTVTVDQYGENVDLSGSSYPSQWSDYEVENPFLQ